MLREPCLTPPGALLLLSGDSSDDAWLCEPIEELNGRNIFFSHSIPHPRGPAGGRAGTQRSVQAIWTSHEWQLLFAWRCKGWHAQKLVPLFPSGINDVN